MLRQYLSRGIFPFLFIFLFMGCLTIRPGSVKAGKSLYETFLAGNGRMMYYLKPLDFVQQAGKGSMEMDFTFQYSNVTNDTGIVKFSVFDQAVLKTIDSMRIQNNNVSVLFSQVQHMFSDRGHKNYVNRFSAETPLSMLLSLFKQPDWQVSLYRDGKELRYKATAKTGKKITTLEQHVFAVF